MAADATHPLLRIVLKSTYACLETSCSSTLVSLKNSTPVSLQKNISGTTDPSLLSSAGDLVVVSPDVGGVARARAFAKKLSDAPLAIVDKRRSAHNVSEVMNIIGDVRGKVAVLVDDMIDTAGTITNAGKVLHEEGAKAVYACATHAVFSPPASERLSSGAFLHVSLQFNLYHRV